MSWVKTTDEMPLSRKVKPLSDAAYRLDSQALHYCARHETDGLVWLVDLGEIVLGVKGKRVQAYIEELTSATLWHQPGEACESKLCPAHYEVVPDSAWVKHDYFEYQPSHGELDAQRVRKQDAARLGGLASGKSRRQKATQKNELGAKHGASVLVELQPNEKRTNGEPPRAQSRPVPSRIERVSLVSNVSANTREALAICQALEVLGGVITPKVLDDAEGLVAEFRIPTLDEFVAAIEGSKGTHVKSLIYFRQRFRELNDSLRDAGRKPRDHDHGPRVDGLVSVAASKAMP